MYRRMITITTCLIGSLFMAVAQTATLPVTRHISTSNGLSNDFVVRMALDGDGYVWVATESGVSRIAGSRCTMFNTAEGQRHKPIVALSYHKPTHQMLMSTEGRNLSIFDSRKGKMLRMTKADGLQDEEIEDIARADDGKVWLMYANGSVQKMNPKNYELTPLSLSEVHATRCGMDDGKGHLYMGHSQHGMTVVDIGGQGFKRFVHEPGIPKSLPGNNVRRILMDHQQRIWVGTDHGLALFHPENGTFDKISGLHDDYDDNVYDICEMADGSIWVALDMGGIRIVNALSYDDTRVLTSSINTRAIVTDEFGNVWVGNHSTGIDFISAEESVFHILDYQNLTGGPAYVNALCSDEGYMWTASESEIAKWQDNQLLARWTNRGNTRREYNFIRTMMADSRGNLWVGVDDQGAYRFNRQTGQMAPVNLGHNGYDVHAFAEDANGHVWIGSEVGVYTCHGDAVQRQESIEKLVGGLPVSSFVWLDNGQMIVASIGAGLHVIGGDKLDATNGLPSNKINQVIKDDDTGLWIATYDGLVHVKNAKTLKDITTYDRRNGLADNHIRALQLDPMGRVWMSTYSGISCFDPKTGHFYNYNQFGNRYLSGFAIGGAMKDYMNRLYFASAQGVCYFNPVDIDSDTRVSQVQIVNCEAYNPVDSDTEILTLTPDADSCVYASYDQNTLRLLFAVRNPAESGREEYSYMMKGMNDHWYYIGNDQEVVFRGLAPGNYTFILRAKLREQDWESASQTLIRIQILPPLWRRWWAYLIYALLIGGGVLVVLRKCGII